MLIFRPHLPHVITNSRRPLHDLSHSKIILEGSVSISTCDFEALSLAAKTAVPNAAE